MFGFDDGTTGRFWNEVSEYYNTNCTNTCGTPRSELKTHTEFVDCTYNYTECFTSSQFRETIFINRTQSEHVNRFRIKVDESWS